MRTARESGQLLAPDRSHFYDTTNGVARAIIIILLLLSRIHYCIVILSALRQHCSNVMTSQTSASISSQLHPVITVWMQSLISPQCQIMASPQNCTRGNPIQSWGDLEFLTPSFPISEDQLRASDADLNEASIQSPHPQSC